MAFHFNKPKSPDRQQTNLDKKSSWVFASSELKILYCIIQYCTISYHMIQYYIIQYHTSIIWFNINMIQYRKNKNKLGSRSLSETISIYRFTIVRTHRFSIRYTVESRVTERKPVDSDYADLHTHSYINCSSQTRYEQSLFWNQPWYANKN